MLHCVIMAGGSGTRFWPESRADRPKQLLPMFGPKTLLQETVDRLAGLVDLERIWIATTERLAPAVAQQLPELRRDALVIEPCKRDTAPCIGLAALRLLLEDPEATMAVLPADQRIAPVEVFQQAMRVAVALVEQAPTRLVTFGIRPTYPAETFGYIERGEAIACPALETFSEAPAVYRVRQFHEKPKAATAEQYLQAGTFYWNSGIFVWKARTILAELQRYQPEIYVHLERIGRAVGTPEFDQVVQTEFAAIQGISIDYAVMEHAQEVAVVEAPFTWDDVGNWRALERWMAADEFGNVVAADRTVLLDTTGAIVRSTDPTHLVVTVGVQDLLIVVTPDATLIADKKKEESLRKITQLLAERGWTEYL